MSISLHLLLIDLAAELNALDAATQADAKNAYVLAATADVSIRPEWPDGMLRQALLDAEYYWVEVVAQTPKHPARGALLAESSDLASGAVLPKQTEANVPFLGVIDRVKDSATGRNVRPTSVGLVQSYLTYADSLYTDATFAMYALDGDTILHTFENVKVRRVAVARQTWWAVESETANNMLLPDNFRRAYVDKALTLVAGVEGQWLDVVNAADKRCADFESIQRAYADPAHLRRKEAPKA